MNGAPASSIGRGRAPVASLVIATWSKAPRLRLTLASIAGQPMTSLPAELILVDDGSEDSTAAVIAEWQARQPEISVTVLHQERAGRSAARNTGVALATAPLVVFADDDTLLPPGFLEAHVAAHHGGDGRRVVHGPVMAISDVKFMQDPSTGELYPGRAAPAGLRPAALSRRLITEQDVSGDLQRLAARGRRTRLEKEIERVLGDPALAWASWIAVTGGNVSVSRALFDEVGGFDESFGLHWGGEDLELGYRLLRAGAEIRGCNAAMNLHLLHARGDWADQLRQVWRRIGELHPGPAVQQVARFLLGEIDHLSPLPAEQEGGL